MFRPVVASGAHAEGVAPQYAAAPWQRSTLNPSSLFALSVQVRLIQSGVNAIALSELGAAGGSGGPTVIVRGAVEPVPPRPSNAVTLAWYVPGCSKVW